MALLLQPHIGYTQHCVKNLSQLVKILGMMHLDENNNLRNFVMKFLFTKVPVGNILELFKDKFSMDNINHFEHCLTSTYLVWRDTFFEQMDRAELDSPLNPVVAHVSWKVPIKKH